MKCDEHWNTCHFSIILITLYISAISSSLCQFCSNGVWSFDSGTPVPHIWSLLASTIFTSSSKLLRTLGIFSLPLNFSKTPCITMSLAFFDHLSILQLHTLPLILFASNGLLSLSIFTTCTSSSKSWAFFSLYVVFTGSVIYTVCYKWWLVHITVNGVRPKESYGFVSSPLTRWFCHNVYW